MLPICSIVPMQARGILIRSGALRGPSGILQTSPCGHLSSQQRFVRENTDAFCLQAPDSPYEVIALIDIDKAAQSFFGESDDRALAILNDEGQVLYTLGSMNQDQLPTFEAGQKAVLKDGTYYFAEAGSDGLTYVSAVPYSHVSSRSAG